MRDEYWYTNANRQITDFSQLDEQGKREARIRNLCFGATLSWVGFCSIYEYCKLCENGVCEKLPSDKKFGTYTFNEYCTLSKTDCFTESVDKIFKLLQNSNDPVFSRFYPDMNNVTKAIANGNEDISYIDTDKSICYKTDDNGDTVWHAFVRNNRDIWSWADLCVSLNDNPFDMLTKALYKTPNKKGKTALQEALYSTNPNNLFGFFLAYANQEGKKNCTVLIKDIQSYNREINITKLKSALNCQ